jgi:hypothetical protein
MDILSIDENSPGGGCVEPVKQTEDGGFTASRRSDDSYLLTSRNGKSEIFENEPLRMISERDVIKLDRTSLEL